MRRTGPLAGSASGGPGRWLLAAVSVTLTLLAAEGVARLAPPPTRLLSAEALWRAQAADPGAAVLADGVEIAGVTFRDAALPDAAFEGDARRVLFLGDSFTVGWGLARRAERFTDRVEAALASEPGGSVHFFNAARGGTNPDLWERYLESLAPVTQPHAVVAVFFLRDGTNLGTSLQLNRKEIAPIRARARARPLHGESALLTRLWEGLAWREYNALFVQKLERAYLGSHAERASWRRQQRALLAMQERCRRRGIALHLVVFPMLFDLDAYAFHEVEREIARFAERNGMPHFSLTPAFLGRDDRTLWVASNDQHPNAEGHRIAAERLLPYLRDVVLAPKEGS